MDEQWHTINAAVDVDSLLNTNNNADNVQSIINPTLSMIPRLRGVPRKFKYYPRINDTDTWAFCVEEMLSYSNMFARNGSTPFIHRSLYGGDKLLPPPLRTVFGVCAAYSAWNDSNQCYFIQLLDSAVEELAPGAPCKTFVDWLARLQAMLLYHITRFFCGDVRQCFCAEQQEILLANWTADLQETELPPPPEEQGSSGSQYEATWDRRIMHESARRTILVSYLVRAVYSVLKYRS